MKSTIAFFLVAIALSSQLATVQATQATQRPLVRRYPSRVGISPNARSFVAIPFPSPQPAYIGNVVFTPNGTAYFTDARNEMASFTRAGVYTRIPVSHAVVGPTLLYARGDFWMRADRGIVKVAPDGSRRRWYPLTVPGYGVDVVSLAAGPDGGIYVVALLIPDLGGVASTVIFRIGTDGAVTTTSPFPVSPVGNGAAIFGADKLLYFGYTSLSSAGIARVELDGSLTLFPIAGSEQTVSFVLSKGNIYFDNLFNNAALKGTDGQLGRITPAGVVSLSALPATGPSTVPSSLSVDKGGNLWVVVYNAVGINQYFLYQYNVYTGHFNGPYLTGLPNPLYDGPVVAPDDSVWIALQTTSDANPYPPVGFGIFVNGT